MPWNDGKCLLWGTPARIEHDQTGDSATAISPRAGGKFSITGTAQSVAENLSQGEKAIVTFWMVKQRSLGVECPSLDSNNLQAIRAYPPPSVFERMDFLLRYADYRGKQLGHVFKFYELDNSMSPDTANELLAWTGSIFMSEVLTLVEYCAEQGWIEHKVYDRDDPDTDTSHEFMLRPKGYARLIELKGTNSTSQQGFVAMWFGESMDDVFNKAIAPAIADAGYLPLRIDKKDHVGKIDDEKALL